MDGYLRQFTLDVNAENNHQRIPAKQGDAVNRQLEITLRAIPTGASQLPTRQNLAPNVVQLVPIARASPVVGALGRPLQVVFQRVVLSDFILDVIPMPNIGNLVPSSTEWKRLMEAIETAENFSDILAFRENNGWIQYTTDNSTWKNLCEISDIVVPITTAEIDELWP